MLPSENKLNIRNKYCCYYWSLQVSLSQPNQPTSCCCCLIVSGFGLDRGPCSISGCEESVWWRAAETGDWNAMAISAELIQSKKSISNWWTELLESPKRVHGVIYCSANREKEKNIEIRNYPWKKFNVKFTFSKESLWRLNFYAPFPTISQIS